MSARNKSLWHSLIVGLTCGAAPVDGIVWFDPNDRRPTRETPAARSEAKLHEQVDDCEDCPAPIF